MEASAGMALPSKMVNYLKFYNDFKMKYIKKLIVNENLCQNFMHSSNL